MSSQQQAGREWVVMLEVADESGGPGIDSSTFARLVASWAGPAPTTLYSPNRYALQVPLTAVDAASALAAAMTLWKQNLRGAELPEWELVRAEVLTARELELELEAAEVERGTDSGSVLPRLPDPMGDDLLRRALHDSVTGLPNRAIFLDEVRGVTTRQSASATHAVMLVHLDVVGAREPSLDRPLPDGVLVDVARRLAGTVRRGDTVARVGPAEFAVLVTLGTAADVDAVASRLVGRGGSPVAHADRVVALTASVGVATTSCGDDAHADDLIAMAEVAMRAAREHGGDRYRQFCRSPSTPNARRREDNRT